MRMKSEELIRELEEARKEAEYYRKMAEESGRRCLQGIDRLTRLVWELREAQEALNKEKEKFRILLEEFPFGVALISEDGRYKYINSRFTEIFGYTLKDVPTGKQWWKKAYPDSEKRKMAISMWVEDLEKFENGEFRQRTFSVVCKDGTEKLINFRSASLRNGDQFVIYEDITRQKRIEKHLIQAQKMDAIGTLAGGIAHDFNNLLMGIQGRASLMLMDIPPEHPHFEELKAIQDIVRSAADLTSQLLGFARGGKYEVRVVSPNEVVEKSFTIFARTRKEIRIHVKYQENAWLIEADPGQIEQVLLNLYINAWQAMPNGGDLYIETSNVTVGRDDSVSYKVEPGNYVKISVSDTGVGMDDGVMERIFEPFFTTRNKERGVGLGLASAYGIVRNHGGVIEVTSEKGKGSTFDIYLPRSRKQVIEEKTRHGKILKGSEKVLLIDDEEEVLHVGRKLLERMGHYVFTAASGEEGIELYKKLTDDIDLVILDMIMPGLGGKETFHALRSINPEVKVLLSSGYSLDGQARTLMEKGCNGFIPKPFRAEDLSRAMRQILDN